MELCLSRIQVGPVRIVLTTEDRVDVFYKRGTEPEKLIARVDFDDLEDDAKTVIRSLADLAN